LCLGALADHEASLCSWSRLLRTGAEFVVKINLLLVALHSGRQGVFGLPMVLVAVRGSTALTILLQRQAAFAFDVAKYEASGYTLMRIFLACFGIATDPVYREFFGGTMPPGPIVVGGAHVQLPEELTPEMFLHKCVEFIRGSLESFPLERISDDVKYYKGV
jgi:hypothetical protein